MNLRQIEIFHAVFANGSVSAAARALNVSQPAVTKTLLHTEQRLGFALFERTKGRLIPTPEARALFAEVEAIQDRVASLRQASRNLALGRGSQLRIAALPSLGLAAVPRAMAGFLARHPDSGFDLQTLHHDEMVRRLYERETDVAIAFEVPPGAPVEHHRLGAGELVLLFRPEDWPDAPAQLPLELLQDRRLVSTILAGPLGRLLTDELARRDLKLDEVGSARTYYVAAALVRAGVGMALVDNFTARAATDLAFRRLAPALRFDISAVHLRDHPPSRAMTDFLAVLTAEIARP